MLELEADGGSVPLPAGRRARELLCYLALEPGAHPRGELATRFWPDVLDESAKKSLRNALHGLRQALGEGAERWLEVSRERVGLAEGVWVDLREVARLAAQGDPAAALELCRGELLGGVEAEWALRARDEHRELIGELHERLAAAAERAGDDRAALEHTRQQVRIDPLSEEAHRRLMRRLAAAGDRPAALAAYARLDARLRGELAVAPSEPTRALADELRTSRIAADPAGPAPLPLPAALARAHRSPLVGREGVLAALREGWARAKAGERRLALLSGEPGIGKSRLLAEAGRIAHADGATVLYGRCQAEALAPYEPFAEALRPYIAATDPDDLVAIAGPLAGELVRLCPDQAGRLPSPAAAGTDPEGARYRLFEATATLLGAAARSRPVLVALDDLHWAGAPSLLLLRHLARSSPAPILVLGTYRESELPGSPALVETLAELRSERLGEVIGLARLGTGDVAELVAAWLGAGAPAELAGALAERTRGNPFFCEEVLHELGARGEAQRPASVAELEVPQGVKEVLGHRLAALGEGVRRTLALAAVAGREFELELLESASELDRDELVAALDAALAAQLVDEDTEPGRAGRYAFRHALVQEAIYDELSATRRARWHGRIGAALEALGTERAEERLPELARHFLAAGDAADAREKAVDYARRAGERAAAQLDYEEAAGWLARALAALGDGERDAARRLELTLGLADARQRAGDLDAAREGFAAAAAEARELAQPEPLARAALGRGGLGVTILDVDPEQVALLEEALAALGDADPALRARLLGRLAVELYYDPGARERSEALGAEAVELARASGDGPAIAYALNARHVALWRPDRLAERTELAREMLATAERARDRDGELQARNWLVTDLFEAGEIDALDGEIDAYERLAGRQRLPGFEWYGPLWRGALAVLRGEFSAAEPRLEEARRMGALAGDRNAGVLVDMLRWEVRHLHGEFEAAWEIHNSYSAGKFERSPASFAWICGEVFGNAACGRAPQARAALEQAAEIGLERLPFDVNWLDALGLLGEACALLRETDWAAQIYELLLPYADRHAPATGRALASLGAVGRPLALMAASLGRDDEAERHFEAALAHNERLGFRPWLVWTRGQFAAMLDERGRPGDRERADELRAAADELADELSLDGLRDRIPRVSVG